MSTKRTKDPAGLIRDRLTISFTDPKPGDVEAMRELLESSTPRARIDYLRMHQGLIEIADSLAARLSPEGTASRKLLDDIEKVEFKALYLVAAPAMIEKKRRKAGLQTVTDNQIRAAVCKHKYFKDAAVDLGLTEKQLRNRRREMEKRNS